MRVNLIGLVEEDGSFLLVAVANSQSFGGGMKVTPDASLVDGKLDVFTLDPLSRLAFLRIYPRVFKGLHVTDPRVKIRKAKTYHSVSIKEKISLSSIDS